VSRVGGTRVWGLELGVSGVGVKVGGWRRGDILPYTLCPLPHTQLHHPPTHPTPHRAVSVLLSRLSDIRSADPAAKVVIFSTWGRLLRLVGGALKDNGIPFASMMGGL